MGAEYLKKYGLLENPSKGIWSLTAKAKQIETLNPPEIVRAVRVLTKKESVNNNSELLSPQDVSQDQEWKQKLHNIPIN